MPSAEWNAARRKERLQAHQNALAPEKRMVNRTDWDAETQKAVSFVTARARQYAKEKFLMLAVEPDVNICETREDALTYFTRGGPPFTTAVLRKFAEAVAICGRPTLLEGAMSARSCASTLMHIWAIAKVSGNPIHRDAKEASLHYIFGPLVTEGLVHTTARSKVTPVPDDLTDFMKVLFSPRFAHSITSTREVLLLALFVCLQVDCSSRISELVMPSMSTKDMKMYSEKHPEKTFRWSGVEVFAFPNQGPGGRVTLRARLTFYGIKDVTRKGFREKTIPLRLLPPGYVAEDSLFWLVTLGLIDGVFANISTWDSIERLQPGEKGLMLPVKAAFRDCPVFRPTKYHANVTDHLVSKDQMTSHQILDKLHKLSMFCGLRQSMLPNVLRRGSAYLLALNVTPEERKARMGHSENSQVYWGAYRNTTSTVDFQALRLNIEQDEGVAAMSSVFLNTNSSLKSDDPPPARVSDEGMSEILNSPELAAMSSEQFELAAMSSEQFELLDELLTKYGSLDDAATQNPVRHGRYQTLRKKYAEKLAYLQVQRYKSEYKAWWSAKEGRSNQAGFDVLGDERSEIEQLLDESQAQEDEISDSLMDPQLLEQEADALAAASSLATEMSAAADSLDAVQNAPEASASKDSHSISSVKPRTFVTSDADLPRYTLLDGLPALLYDQPDTATWSTLSATCTTLFNHLHSPGRFYPNQEPLPGTWECRFCDISFLGDSIPRGRSPESHSFLCEAQHLADHVRSKLQQAFTPGIGRCPLGHCRYSMKNTNDKKFIAHARGAGKHYRNDLEPEFLCSNHAAPFVFHSQHDFRIHAITAHSVPPSTLPQGAIIKCWSAFIYFCPFCQVFISRVDELEEDHIRAHIDAGDATRTINDHGIIGYMRSGVWTHPGFCIFCLYDTRLSVLKRFNVYSTMYALLEHIGDHVQSITDTMCCPASGPSVPENYPRCTENARFDAAGMGAHLEEAHDISHRVSTASSRAKEKRAQRASNNTQEDLSSTQQVSVSTQQALDNAQQDLDGVQEAPSSVRAEGKTNTVKRAGDSDVTEGSEKKRKTGEREREPLTEMSIN